jgi:hypothetical protein
MNARKSVDELRHEIEFYDKEVDRLFEEDNQFQKTYTRELELHPSSEFALERCRDRLTITEGIMETMIRRDNARKQYVRLLEKDR